MPTPTSTTSLQESATNSTTHSTSWNAKNLSKERASQQPVHLIELHNVPILQQLQIEEALLRADSNNWILLNRSAPPAIVLGISGKEKELVNWPLWHKQPIPLIRRFSGGGTVVVDADTLFVTFIMNSDAVEIDPHPLPIMRWTESLYRPLFGPDFLLREHDYCLAERKVGGNAQYIRKGRWLHHTTLLWDYDPNLMNLLTLPQRQPTYREGREHAAFLTTLRPHFASLENLVQQLRQLLHSSFHLVSPKEHMETYLARPHRQSTSTIKSLPLSSLLQTAPRV